MDTSDILVTNTERGATEMAADLKKLLMAHDRSLQQIVFIDNYISRLDDQAFKYMRQGKKGQALRTMNRKSVALGIKHMYRVFRLRKWYQVQQLVTVIMQTLQNHSSSHQTPPMVEATGEAESKQIEIVARTLMVVYSNFSREI